MGRSQESGDRRQESGVRRQKSGVRRQETVFATGSVVSIRVDGSQESERSQTGLRCSSDS